MNPRYNKHEFSLCVLYYSGRFLIATIFNEVCENDIQNPMSNLSL